MLLNSVSEDNYIYGQFGVNCMFIHNNMFIQRRLEVGWGMITSGAKFVGVVLKKIDDYFILLVNFLVFEIYSTKEKKYETILLLGRKNFKYVFG